MDEIKLWIWSGQRIKMKYIPFLDGKNPISLPLKSRKYAKKKGVYAAFT